MENVNHAIFSLAYLPPLNYFYYSFQSDILHIEMYETYQKQSFRNRAYILSAQGVLALHVPIIHPQDKNILIKEIKICRKTSWELSHFRSMEACYNNSPFFMHYKDEIWNILNKKHEFLHELNMDFFTFFLKKLAWKKEIRLTEKYIFEYPPDMKDYRSFIHPKKKAETKLLPYLHTFENKNFPIEHLSILDLLCNTGKSYF